jgi:hypothetical protein
MTRPDRERLTGKVLGRWASDEVLLRIDGSTRQLFLSDALVAAGRTPDPGCTISAQIGASGEVVAWRLAGRS